MPDIWDDRKKSLEEDYFRRKDQEAIEKLRAQREAERAQREAEGKTLHCPKCEGTLLEIIHEEVPVDRCNQCNGVWLDAGELELLAGREKGQGWFTRMFKNVSSE
jgi:uncharacterized protein